MYTSLMVQDSETHVFCLWGAMHSITKITVHSVTPGRWALVSLLVVLVEGIPILENPHSSLIMMHTRMSWLIQRLREFKIPVSRLLVRNMFLVSHDP